MFRRFMRFKHKQPFLQDWQKKLVDDFSVSDPEPSISSCLAGHSDCLVEERQGLLGLKVKPAFQVILLRMRPEVSNSGRQEG